MPRRAQIYGQPECLDTVYNTIGAIISLSGALFGSGQASLFAFPAVGFFAAVMWSVIISLALNSVAEDQGTFSGILVSGIVGGAVVPLILGSLDDAFGLHFEMMFLNIIFGYILSIGFWAKPW